MQPSARETRLTLREGDVDRGCHTLSRRYAYGGAEDGPGEPVYSTLAAYSTWGATGYERADDGDIPGWLSCCCTAKLYA